MHRLQTYSRSLKEVFEDTLTVRHMASPLASFDAERPAQETRDWLASKDFDQVGVRREGTVVGFARRADLGAGNLDDNCILFGERHVVSGDMPLLKALELVAKQPAVFVTTFGEVNGIVTPSDVGRPPVRLWLFGLVTISEMQLTRIIRLRYPDQSWEPILPPRRYNAAKRVLSRRKQHQTEVDLMDCLTLDDKQILISSSPELRAPLALPEPEAIPGLFKRVTALRNDLAHAYDITTKWPQFLDDARALEKVIEAAERITSKQMRTLLAPRTEA